MLEVLAQLQIYRPDMADEAGEWMEIFSQPPNTTIVVADLQYLVPLLLAYIAAVDQDDRLTQDERDLLVAIPNIWLEAIRNFNDSH